VSGNGRWLKSRESEVFGGRELRAYVECGPMAKSPKPLQAAPTCQPFSKILVSAFAPGTEPETVTCTSNKAFLVYCSTNFTSRRTEGSGYFVNVKSTGAGVGSLAPTYIVGGPANDVITFNFSPGLTGFLTLQTECGARASISG
jgi:hypothetical protein